MLRSGPGEDPSKMIPKACCAYQVIRERVIAMVDDECNARTGLQTGTFVSDIVKSVVSALTELACGKSSGTACSSTGAD